MFPIEAKIDSLLERWAAWVIGRPAFVLLVAGVLSVIVGGYAALNLGVNADTRNLIAADAEFKVRQQALTTIFKGFDHHSMFVLVDADSPFRAHRVADDLAERLRKRPDLFEKVFVPGGGPFFEKHALLYLKPEQIDALVSRLSEVQPFMAELARDQSLVGISDLLRLALKMQREGTAVGLDLATALDRVSAAVEAAAAGRTAPDPWSSELLGDVLPGDANRQVILLKPVLDYSTLLNAQPAIAAIDSLVQALDLTPEKGVHVRVTGEPVINYEEQSAVRAQSVQVAVVSFVLFTTTVCFALRSLRVVLALTGSLIVSLILSNGFATVAVGHLNQISAAFNVLIIGLGGEFGIHYAMRYMELIGRGRQRDDALVETSASIGGSLFSSACTTSLGLYVFMLTDFTGVAQLGLIAGTGIFLSLASTLTVLPALIALRRTGAGKPPPVPPRWVTRLEHLPLVYASPIRIAVLALGLGAVLLLPRTRFDYNQLNLRDPSTESVQAMDDLLSSSSDTPWTIDTMAPGLDAARALAAKLAALPVVERAITLEDVVPKDQDEKIEMLEQALYLVPESFAEGPAPSAETQTDALRKLREEAGLARRDGRSDAVAASARRLADALGGYLGSGNTTPSEDSLRLLRSNMLGSLLDQIKELKPLLSPGHVTLADLPQDIAEQMLAADGRARVQVYPRRDMSDSRALEEFVDGVRAVAPDAAGSAVWLVEWGRVTWHAMLLALAVGLVCMTALLVVLWQSAWDTGLAFFPLLLAALLTCAVLVLFDHPFNFANVIVLPMLIGMGVDSGVHLVHRHRTNPEEVDVIGTSTARAVFFSALTTILSFGSLGFAPHQGIASVGQLLTVGVGLTLICYVVVLPAILEWDDRHRRRPGRG